MFGFKRKTVTILASLVFSCVSLTTISLAGFTTSKLCGQSVMHTAGKQKKSIFFDYVTWNSLGTEVYYMYVWNTGTQDTEYLLPSKAINIDVQNRGGSGTTTNRNLKVFEYDTLKYNRLKFYRVNPRYLGETNLLSGTASEFRLLSSATTWTYSQSDISLYQDKKDNNHYVANGVSFTKDTTFKIHDGTNYYSNDTAPNHAVMVNGAQSDIKITTAGTHKYTIDFYKSASNHNHIVLTQEDEFFDYSWNDTQDITSGNSNFYKISGWSNDNGKSGYNASTISPGEGKLILTGDY